MNTREITKGIEIYEIVCRNNYETFEKEIANNNTTDNTLSKEIILKMLTWENTPIVLEGWQIKIIQQSYKDNSISKFREAELLRIKKLLLDHGFK